MDRFECRMHKATFAQFAQQFAQPAQLALLSGESV
jgi:hypothetical protein